MPPGPVTEARPLATPTTPFARAKPISEPPFELKFLVNEALAERVAAWAAEHLAPDPHCGLSSEEGYRVTSLYLDTPRLHVYHRQGSYGRAKYRVRRYDTSPTLFLERKCKVRGRVRKRRTEILEEELGRLLDPKSLTPWTGRWFARRVEARGLVPTCLVAYDRIARMGPSRHGPIRLTIDRAFQCRASSTMEVPWLSDANTFYHGQRVVELKYRIAMPALFKTLMSEFGLTPARPSKYRSGVEGSKIQAPPSANGRADA